MTPGSGSRIPISTETSFIAQCGCSVQKVTCNRSLSSENVDPPQIVQGVGNFAKRPGQPDARGLTSGDEMTMKFAVHKFGGTSLADAQCFRRVAALVNSAHTERKPEGKSAIVVSAMAGVTDGLHRLVDLAVNSDAALPVAMESLRQRHKDTAQELLGPTQRKAWEDAFEMEWDGVGDVLRATTLLKHAPVAALEFVVGHGELWSSRLLAAYLEEQSLAAVPIDAREYLTLEAADKADVLWDISKDKLQQKLAGQSAEILVITGYIAAFADGTPTTLKRNGSDYSAAIFASLLDAEELTIWTDVSGVLSADPRTVPEAVVTHMLSYREAMELAYFGAKVLHPSTMAPLVEKSIPIWIRNTFSPQAPGTCISDMHASGNADDGHSVRGFASIDQLALINVEGTGMIGVPGVAQRVFGALREVGVSVVLISQASSEHSICFAVPEAQGALAQKTVRDAFWAEIQHGKVQEVQTHSPVSILAAVGDRMVEKPGVAGKFFGALGSAGVSVRAIAQGSSERNISVVIDQHDASRALRAVHAAFYLSEQTLSLAVVGVGGVGATFLSQLADQAKQLQERKIDIRVRALASSKRMVLDDVGIPPGEWQQRLEDGEPLDLDKLTQHLHAPHLPHRALVDCTAADLGPSYEKWLDAGVHVITPNKKAGAGSMSRYKTLRRLSSQAGKGRYLYEATVGAGLPVISTLRDLLQTGDRILSIEGIFSGTLAYLFNAFDGSRPFSDIVRQAKELGFTEPDPRDDLSGTDVARKLVILAREMGGKLSLDDIPIESLVSADLQDCDGVESFMSRLPEQDAAMHERLTSARDSERVLRYVGAITADGKAEVALRAFPHSHAFARLQGSDNIIAFTTERYREQPLIVQGPGAGREVTAGGVFSDLLRLAAHLGAPN